MFNVLPTFVYTRYIYFRAIFICIINTHTRASNLNFVLDNVLRFSFIAHMESG